MVLPDVNVLVYAFRTEAPYHSVCNAWLTNVIASDAQFAMSPLALGALVRITTRVHNQAEPSTLAEAFAFSDYILAQPNCQIVEPRERHWDIFKRLCLETATRGRRVTDAWYAALAIESGCEWVTMDGDFARFPGLRWSKPTSP